MPQLGQLAVVDDRVADADLPAALRLRTEQVALRTDRRLHRRDQLFADRVERRIRHLREELLEVVVQQPGFVGQDRQRCVGTHRTNRLFAGASHRLEHLLDVLARVSERLLPTQHGLVIRLGQVRSGRYGLDRNQVLLQPLGVRVLASQLVLDLVVRDDAPLFGVDQEHLPGMEPLLDDDVLRWNVEDADFGREHDQVVLRDVVPRRAEAVAIQNGADHPAVRERDGRRTVPRLHQRRVVFVERPPLGADALVVLPRLRNHHQHGVREWPPRHHEELEDVVERRRVAATLADDRQHLLELVAENVGLQERLARLHPVDVAAQRVDFTVVGDVAVGMSERPGREGVRAEPLVHERERRLHGLVREVEEERRNLARRQHALVDQRSGRQADDVERLLRLGREPQGVHFVLDPLADHVQLALERVAVGDRVGARPMKSCLKIGSAATARGPSSLSLVGTSRQPSSC